MRLNELAEIFIDPNFQSVNIYSLSLGKVIFGGVLGELPKDLQDVEVASIDTMFEPTDFITVNIG